MRLQASALSWMFVVATAALPAAAQQDPHSTTRPVDPTARTTTKPATTQSGEKAADRAGDHVFVTKHSLRLGDHTLNYTATAGTIAQKDEAGATKADMFFVAYTLDRDEKAARPTTRPVTFVFNGGPGAASVWLHLGAAGPMRVGLDDNGLPSQPPFHLVDNGETWLDATDLVFIDPVGTGYSRPAQGE